MNANCVVATRNWKFGGDSKYEHVRKGVSEGAGVEIILKACIEHELDEGMSFNPKVLL